MAIAAAAAGSAFALQITSLSPQGEVARVRQIVAKFDTAAVRFGDPKAPAPLTVSCSDARAGKGTGRWTADKQWVYDFENDLPPGVRCTVSTIAGFKGPDGSAITGPARYQFTTGGPYVRSMSPAGGRIDEQQAFLLLLNGAATTQSVMANVWCAVEGMGERVPVKALDAAQREALLEATQYTEAAKRDQLRFVTLQCNRTLTPGSRVQIVYGTGVATPSGVANTVEKRFSFQVREPFAASFTCERENAQAGCLPMRPMELRFNAPVPRALAAQIRLKGPGKSIEPKFEEGSAADEQVESISFASPFSELTQYTIELPSGFKDVSERQLGNPGSFPMTVRTGAMPPLAKFAASPFGVIERLAEPEGGAMMPVTVRRVEPALAVKALTPGKVTDLNPKTDGEIIAWFRKVRRYETNDTITRKQARIDTKGPLPKV
ncbi:MAG TPA: alpha-2-macroglobulin, partial [Rhizobacter sp.]|nr:alpha-2-macroglobulin [Rhizobacter sp.]